MVTLRLRTEKQPHNEIDKALGFKLKRPHPALPHHLDPFHLIAAHVACSGLDGFLPSDDVEHMPYPLPPPQQDMLQFSRDTSDTVFFSHDATPFPSNFIDMNESVKFKLVSVQCHYRFPLIQRQ
ncbi:uncharacterized protein G2W53_030827 [Senna tora]|uniref:Uncharacterized protein n=1 Tax=Senna tora TaxID=362788 RepID=A0A834WDB7_9FABA|nr:uncharacterized protein G2W53_030827 [Senna tora]